MALWICVGQAIQKQGRFERDCRMVRTAGETLEVNLQGVACRTPTGILVTGTIQDVTERKRTERDLLQSRERLRQLALHEVMAVENERKRIAREVHDELGQLLTVLRMDLSMLLVQGSELSPKVQSRLDTMRQTLRSMTDVVRHVAAHLRPAALDMGLAAAIEWLAEDFLHRWEVACEVQVSHGDELKLPEPVELALFRAVQESLTNIARHASAQHVSIRMFCTDQALHLSVKDDGRGFDSAGLTRRRAGGLGLLGMSERLLAIGAQLSINSLPQAGTSIDIIYPWSRLKV